MQVLKYFIKSSIFLILILFSMDLVVLLIKYKNNGFLRIAEPKHQYCLLLK